MEKAYNINIKSRVDQRTKLDEVTIHNNDKDIEQKEKR